MSKTPEQIRADALIKAEQEIQRAETKAQIVESLPIAPQFVHVHTLYRCVGSAKYEVKTKLEAFNIYKQFLDVENVLPSYICKGQFTSVKCFDDEQAQEVSEVFACVEIDKFKASLQFFTQTKAGIIHIEIEMPVGLFGQYRKDSPRAVKNYRLMWQPLPETLNMFLAVNYAASSHYGDMSANTKVYVLYDKYEMENQFSGE